MNIIYDDSTGMIRGVGPFTQGKVLTGTLPSDFPKYFGLGKYLARPLSDTTAEVYLNADWTNPSLPSTVIGANVGNTAYVDAVYGNDLTGKVGSAAYPFLTLAVARDSSQSGTTIVVQPGSYTGTNLVKDGITWDFHEVKISTAAPLIDNGVDGVNSDVNCTILGDLDLTYTGTGPAINAPRSGSKINIKMHSVTASSGTAISMACGNSTFNDITASVSAFVLSGSAACCCESATGASIATLSGSARLRCSTATASSSSAPAFTIGSPGLPYISGNYVIGDGPVFSLATGATFASDMIINKAVGSLAETGLAYGQITVI